MSKQLKKNILILFFIFSANIYAQEQDESIEISAYYTKLTTGQDWEKYDRTGQFSDIVVDFGDGNGKFVFLERIKLFALLGKFKWRTVLC